VSRTSRDEDTILHDLAPRGVGRFGRAALRAGLGFDSRLPARAGAAPDIFAGQTEPAAAQATGGLTVQLSSFVVPRLWDADAAYGGVDGAVTAYVGHPRAHLAMRVGGRRLWGDYAWFDAAPIGGATNRGFPSQRFVGDASLFGGLELRTWIGSLDTPIIPVRLGLVVLGDVGRVWLDGETSRTWHSSAGGGLLAQPLGLPLTLHAIAGRSREGTRLWFGAGFPF
jgi:hypothetical protein